MINNIIAVDVGFGLTKGYNGIKDAIVLRSVLGTPQKETFTINNNVFKHLPQQNTNTITIDGLGSFFVGDNALMQSGLKWSIRDKDRSLDDIKILSLAAMSQMGIGGNVSLMTGLPVKWFLKQKDTLQSGLQGSYIVNGKEINITKCHVIVQPAGSYFSLLFDNKGNVKRPEFINKKIGVIDVGMYTTDIIAMDGATFIETRSNSTTVAMAKLYQLTKEQIEETYDLTLDIATIETAIKNGYITIQGQQTDISNITNNILEMLQKTIFGYISNVWADYHKQLDYIFLSGGGASTLAPYLKQHFPQLENITNSHIANVVGYYRYNCFLHNRGQ